MASRGHRRGPAPCTTPANNVHLTRDEMRWLVAYLRNELGLPTAEAVVIDQEMMTRILNKVYWKLLKEEAKSVK